MKICPICGDLKEISEFNKEIKARDGKHTYCRKCVGVMSTKHNREVKGCLPMSENKNCTQYLGVAVAERLVRHLFKDVIRMPNNNYGFDFICSKDKKIDVKSSCIMLNNNKNPHWNFHIEKNQNADYFLLLAFNNRDDLDPLHQWLIPGDVLNHLSCAGISLSTIYKWDEYRQDIGAAQVCCNKMKEMK